MNPYDMARKMLKLDPAAALPKKLGERLLSVEIMCEEVGGKLISRQIVALIVTQYLRDHGA